MVHGAVTDRKSYSIRSRARLVPYARAAEKREPLRDIEYGV
jgi:hypothetical protein